MRFALLIITALLVSCGGTPGPACEQSLSLPPIVPDYCNVTMPCNMVLPSFMVDGATHIRAEVQCGTESMTLEGTDELCLVEINNNLNSLNSLNSLKTLNITLSVWSDEHPDGIRYAPFTITLSPDTIDRYITYRLITPGYEWFHQTGIYQRDLTNYDEHCFVSSQQAGGCVNCHTSCWGKSARRMYHVRGQNGGTMFSIDGDERFVNLKELGLQGSYPAWHPTGRYVAFANTDTHQGFYHNSRDKIEVYDLSGKMFVYDIERNTEITDERFADSTLWHTFPTFGADGHTLYYCRARAVDMPHQVDSLHYELVVCDFDPSTATLGDERVLVCDGSVSFPRVSPDGRFLLYTQSQCGTFPIWHTEADLAMIDLATNRIVDVSALNSDDAESYHCWSGNSRWVMFSSRRDDGRYTRLYFAHVNSNGCVSKPFMLPQRTPRYDLLRLDSYNVPDFTDEEI